MKKVLFLAAAALFSFTVSAQTGAGGILVSGASSVGFSSHNLTSEVDGEEADGDASRSSFNFMPSAGFFVADGIVAGLMVDISTGKETFSVEGGDDIEFSSSRTGVGPFARYYVGESGVFGQGYVSFGNSTETSPDFLTGDDVETEASFFGWGIGLGYALWVSDDIAIDALLSFGGVTDTYDVEIPVGLDETETVEAKDSATGISFSIAVTGVLGAN